MGKMIEEEFKMKIKVEVEVFDDPKYCEHNLYLCDFLEKDNKTNGDIHYFCSLFQRELNRDKSNNLKAFKIYECRIANKIGI